MCDVTVADFFQSRAVQCDIYVACAMKRKRLRSTGAIPLGAAAFYFVRPFVIL